MHLLCGAEVCSLHTVQALHLAIWFDFAFKWSAVLILLENYVQSNAKGLGGARPNFDCAQFKSTIKPKMSLNCPNEEPVVYNHRLRALLYVLV